MNQEYHADPDWAESTAPFEVLPLRPPEKVAAPAGPENRDADDVSREQGPGAVVGAVNRARHNIEVRAGVLHTMATQGEDALINFGAPFYVRGGVVRPIVDELPAAHGLRTNVARLAEVGPDTMLDHLSRAALWVKYDGRSKKNVATDPPRTVALTILSRDGEWRFPKLAGVITTPTLRPDGTVLSTPGYDPETQLLLLDPPDLPPIPEAPSRREARAALVTLNYLLQEFPFVDEASRSVALSALITPVVRGALAVAPLHATTAPVAGSGKSYIIDIAAAISLGQRAPIIAAGRDEAETEKRLVAALLGGQSIISIDNVNGQLGGDFLCQMIERPIVSPRILGVSRNARIESRATCFATGNNIQLVGDMTRRVVLCSLDPAVERPELRQFQQFPFELVLGDRGFYVAAALTVVRAYVAAGYPDQLPPLASFEDWSRLVRSALVWLGCEDPITTMETARAEDPATSNLRTLLAAWSEALGSADRTAGRIIERAESYGQDAAPDLRQALLAVAEGHRGEISAKRLGHYLTRHKGRIIDGLRLVDGEDAHAKQRTWAVQAVS